MGLFKPLPPRLQRGHPLAQGLVGAWEFTEGAGLTAHDSSGCGNHGTLTNGPTWGGGPSGSVVGFNGSTNYIAVPYSPSLGMTTDYTLVAMVKVAAFNTFNVLFTRGDTDDEIEFYFTSTTQGITVAHNREVGTFCYSDNANSGGGVTVGAWGNLTAGLYQLIAVTYTAKTWRVYINGVLKGSASGSGMADPLNAGRPWKIGTTLDPAFGGSGYFDGAMSFARIYNRALSAAEVAQLYQLSGP